MNLSVIVPCYNESEAINVFYDEIKKVLDEEKLTYELIFVDDGSTDNTLSILKEFNKKDKNVKIVSFSRNFGKEAAMLAGLQHSKGTYVSIIDADMQQNPKTLLEMYKKLIDNKDYDVVAAYREKRSNDGAIKTFLTPFFYKIINKISEVKLLPGASDFRVFKKEVKDAILSLKESNRFLKGMFSWVGFNTIYVPYEPDERKYGESKWSLISLIKYAISGIVSFSTFPLSMVFIISIIMFILGFLNIIFGLYKFRSTILFLSLLGLMIGIIALYVARIYKNSLNRPIYIIKEKIGFKSN